MVSRMRVMYGSVTRNVPLENASAPLMPHMRFDQSGIGELAKIVVGEQQAERQNKHHRKNRNDHSTSVTGQIGSHQQYRPDVTRDIDVQEQFPEFERLSFGQLENRIRRPEKPQDHPVGPQA